LEITLAVPTVSSYPAYITKTTKFNRPSTQLLLLDRDLSSVASSTFSQMALRLGSPSKSTPLNPNIPANEDSLTPTICSEATKKVTLCSIAGTSGTCSPAGVNIAVDLTGGTGTVPPASGPSGTTNLTSAELVNLPIRRRAGDM